MQVVAPAVEVTAAAKAGRRRASLGGGECEVTKWTPPLV